MTRKKWSHLDDQLEQEIIKEYLSGSSCRTTGDKFGINQVTVFNVLVRNNVPRRTRGGINPLPMDEIVAKYKTNVSAASIARDYNVTTHTITAILKLYGIPANLNYHNPQLRRDYFDNIDSYDKAYFLGLLLTDGNVSGNSHVKLELQISDKYILETFTKYIKSSNKVLEYIRDKGNKILHTAAFSVKSPELVQALSKYSIVPRKLTKTTLPILHPDMMPHLIRGMIDGDGFISTATGTVGFCGQPNLVIPLHDFLRDTLGLSNRKIRVTNKSQLGPQYHDVCTVTWTVSESEKIANYIYKDKHDCYLTRKFEKSRYSLA